MRKILSVTVSLLLSILLVSGCAKENPPSHDAHPPGGQDGGDAAQEHPLRPYFITALEELRKMNDTGRAGDFQQAEVHFQAFRNAYNQVAEAIGEKDAKVKVHMEQGIEELVIEFQKEVPRAFELDEENMKLSMLLEKGAQLIGFQVPEELVLRRPVEDIPFDHEKTVEITLDEYGVHPAVVEVDVNTKLTLVITNKGKEVHELAVDHYAFEVEDIQPGQTAELTFVTLDKGTFDLACFLPGHYEAGMKADLIVK